METIAATARSSGSDLFLSRDFLLSRDLALVAYLSASKSFPVLVYGAANYISRTIYSSLLPWRFQCIDVVGMSVPKDYSVRIKSLRDRYNSKRSFLVSTET